MDQQRLNQIMQMLEKNPEDSFLAFAAALELKKNQKIDTAISLLKQLLARDKNYLPAYYHLGKMYESISQKEKAKTTWLSGKEIALTQKNAEALHELEEALNSV